MAIMIFYESAVQVGRGKQILHTADFNSSSTAVGTLLECWNAVTYLSTYKRYRLEG